MAYQRHDIVEAFVTLFKDNLNGLTPYTANLYDHVESRLIFWDEVTDYPHVSIVAGPESREYLPGDFKWGYLNIDIRIYVEDENPKDELEIIFNDIETLIDANNSLSVDGNNLCTDIRLLSISDDEGLLSPIGVGEMTFQVQYQVS